MRLYVTDKELDQILRKMFSYVGVEYKKFRTSAPDWYLKHSWTEAQEKAFIKWLTAFLVKKLGMTDKLASKYASYFTFMHGWTYKKEGKK
jgi:hypothetical protein